MDYVTCNGHAQNGTFVYRETQPDFLVTKLDINCENPFASNYHVLC